MSNLDYTSITQRRSTLAGYEVLFRETGPGILIANVQRVGKCEADGREIFRDSDRQGTPASSGVRVSGNRRKEEVGEEKERWRHSKGGVEPHINVL